MDLKIYVDGAARGNPGPAGIGIAIKKGNKTVKEIAAYIGETTNNVAEYSALIRGLEESIKLKAKKVECFSDSELIVKQINGEYRVKNEGLIPLFHHACSLIKKFKTFSISHIAREKNKHADKLANQGIDDKI
ncbi:MAG: ribonuclease HI family protein [Candidatus Margulisiibacteriota bacterium]